MPDDQAESYRRDWIWLLTGLLFILFAGICILIAGRWSRRLLWIYNNVTPQVMKLSIEIDSDAERTTYYAVSGGESEENQGRGLWQVTLYRPGWDVRMLPAESVSAKVYFDPRSVRPAVIETEYGLLWSMAGSGAGQQVARRRSGI